MNDIQNKFYSSISNYYSEIFPYNPIQQKFVENCVGDLTQKQILDIGCATGELAFQLVKSGAKVIGIDLNNDLLKQAVQNKNLPDLKFQQGNMLELAADFQKEQFDAVLCFGNTLVHLPSDNSVFEFLKSAHAVLKPGGQLLMQLLNYDYIVKEQITQLPLIDTVNIKFIRQYQFHENSELIDFKTDLELKGENKTVSNSTRLLALKSVVLKSLLQKAGFKTIQLYANFKQDAFDGTHLPLVLSCER